MNKKRAIKVLSATAVAATAFVATSPAQAASTNDAASLVQKAKQAGTVLKWAISTEGSADGTTRPWAQYNAAKAARDKAVAAVNKLPAAQKSTYLADIEQNVTLHINRTMAYIDAITAGEKIKEKREALEALIAKNVIDDQTEAAYHELSKEIRKQAILLDRVYGKTTRDEIRKAYKQTAETVRDSVKYEVTVKIELDLAKKALAANDVAGAEKHLEAAAKNMAEVKNATMKAVLAKTLDEVEAQMTPKVNSVTVANAKELVITFNKAVDETDAKVLGNYVVEGETFSTTPIVSEDGKTVTLVSDNEIKLASAKVTVKAIKTKADVNVKTAEYNGLLTYTDTVAPAVKSVEAKGTTAVVTFEEPISSAGTVSLNGVALTVTTHYDLSADGKTLTIKNLEADKSYKVDIVGATDFANNIANPIQLNFTVAKPVVDNSKPTVTTTINGTSIVLDFSEELSKQNLDGAAGNDEYAKVTVGSTVFYLKDADIKDSADKTKFTLDASSALGTNTFVNAKVKVEGHKDLAGNAGDTFEFDATLAKDTTAPKFVSVSSKMEVADDTSVTTDVDSLYLTFNEPVKVVGNLTLKSQNGILFTAGAVTAVNEAAGTGVDVDGNGKIEGSELNTVKVAIDLDSNSTYTFELAAGAVTDLAGNPIADALTINVTTGTFQPAPGTVQPTLEFGVTPVVVTDNNVFTVEYAADVTSSATTASNYTLGGKALPAGTQLQFVDGLKKVKITLPEGSITANGSYILEVKNVVDTKGNTLKNGKATTTVVLKENIAPTASKITVVDSKTFTVDFSEAIADAAATGLTVKIAGATVNPASAVVANGKLTVTTLADFSLTDSISVEFKSTNLVDANGNKVKDGVVTK